MSSDQVPASHAKAGTMSSGAGRPGDPRARPRRAHPAPGWRCCLPCRWPKEQSSSPSAEELSPGELRVLRYLPTNLSRPEIAGELSVSPNTVNAHVRSIYAKLQVRDRSSAVRRARELRLLAAGRTR